MLKRFLRIFGIGTDTVELDKFEPIYGLPRRSLDEWLACNPRLKEEYERELVARRAA